MLTGGSGLDGSGSLRTVGTLRDPYAVTFGIFDGQRQLSAELAAAYLKRVFDPKGQWTGIGQWLGVACIEHKQYGPHRLQITIGRASTLMPR